MHSVRTEIAGQGHESNCSGIPRRTSIHDERNYYKAIKDMYKKSGNCSQNDGDRIPMNVDKDD